MVRPSLATTLVVLAVAALGLMAVPATRRASSDRREQPGAVAAAAARGVPAAPGGPAVLASAAAPGAPAVADGRTPPRLRAVEASAAPAPPATPPRPKPHLSIRIRPGHEVALRAKPHGPAVARVGATTQFGSPTFLSVAKQRGGWVGVTSTDLPNG